MDASADDQDDDSPGEGVEPSPDAAIPLGDGSSGDKQDAGGVFDICAGQCDLDDPFACRSLELDPLAPRETYPSSRYQLYGQASDAGSVADDDGETTAEDSGADIAAPADVDASVEPAPPVLDAGTPLTQDAAQPLNGRGCLLAPAEGPSGDMTFQAMCEASGTGRTGATCTVSRDCSPGLACVGGDGAGQCRPFCCAGSSVCGEGQFCTQRALRVGDMTPLEPPLVPVCASTEACDLGEEYPCPDGKECACPAGRTCTVVGETGATGCVIPQGDGQQGDRCPCAPGFLCSEGSRTCHRLCSTQVPTGADDSVCAGHEVCVVNPVFPDGFGLCVSALP